MGAQHEVLLTSISDEFPVETEAMTPLAEIEPPIRQERFLELCGDDEELIALYDEMTEYFYRYTHDVCEQESLMKQDRRENADDINRRDKARTILHNTMIDSVKILARNLRKKGRDATWIEPIDKGGRAGYARLALLTTFKAILEAKPTQ